MYINAGRVFQSAVQACHELSQPELTAQKVGREALGAILLSTIAAETLINEIPHFARNWVTASELVGKPQSSPGWLKALAEMLTEAEESRATIESKYQLAKFIFSGEPFDRGAQVFQNFDLLVDLRNLIVHAKPKEAVMRRDERTGKFVWAEPPIMVRLSNVGVVVHDEKAVAVAERNNADRIEFDLVAQISARPVAVWACQTVSNLVRDLLNGVPQSTFHNLFEAMYQKDFSLPADFKTSATL